MSGPIYNQYIASRSDRAALGPLRNRSIIYNFVPSVFTRSGLDSCQP